MNTLPTSLRHFTLITSLVLWPLAATAAETDRTDRAAELLAMHGHVPLSSATRYVERGTYRVQVAAKLGRPDATLPDGTWLYHGRRVGNSDAVGTLVVRFDGGRVGSLSLVTPAVATAMVERARTGRDRPMLANK